MTTTENFRDLKEALATLTARRAAGLEAKLITHGGGTTGRAPSWTVRTRA